MKSTFLPRTRRYFFRRRSSRRSLLRWSACFSFAVHFLMTAEPADVPFRLATVAPPEKRKSDLEHFAEKGSGQEKTRQPGRKCDHSQAQHELLERRSEE